MRQLFSYLASGDSDRRASCQSGRPISQIPGAKLKAWRHRMFKFTPLLICLCLYRIINHFACWIMNAFSSEKRCPTSMAFWHQADWHTNLPPFQGARPDHVRVESSSCCFPRASWSFVRPRASWRFDPWHVTRSPPIRKRIWVGRYNKLYCLLDVVTLAAHYAHQYNISISRLCKWIKKLSLSKNMLVIIAF